MKIKFNKAGWTKQSNIFNCDVKQLSPIYAIETNIICKYLKNNHLHD